MMGLLGVCLCTLKFAGLPGAVIVGTLSRITKKERKRMHQFEEESFFMEV